MAMIAGGARGKEKARQSLIARHRCTRVKRWGLARGIGRQHMEAELWLAACLA